MRTSMSLAVLAALAISFSGCGDNSSSSSSLTATTSGSVDVTVERGKVYDATVKDSSTPAQVAVQKDGSNVYTFAHQPTYPIVVNGGWVDVDNDGVKTQKDILLNITMESYSNIVTPVTTYIAAPTKEQRDAKLQELLDATQTGELTAQDLMKLPSQTTSDAQAVINAVYGEIVETGSTSINLNEVSAKATELENIDVSGMTPQQSAIAYESAILQSLNEFGTTTQSGATSQDASQDNNTQDTSTQGISQDASNDNASTNVSMEDNNGASSASGTDGYESGNGGANGDSESQSGSANADGNGNTQEVSGDSSDINY